MWNLLKKYKELLLIILTAIFLISWFEIKTHEESKTRNEMNQVLSVQLIYINNKII